jgi:hypothetical protein
MFKMSSSMSAGLVQILIRRGYIQVAWRPNKGIISLSLRGRTLSAYMLSGPSLPHMSRWQVADPSEKRTSRNHGYNEYIMDYNGLQYLDLRMNIH